MGWCVDFFVGGNWGSVVFFVMIILVVEFIFVILVIFVFVLV